MDFRRDALQRESVRKIYAAKGRPSDNPLIVHICRWEDIGKITRKIPEEAQKLAVAFGRGADDDFGEVGCGTDRNHRRPVYRGRCVRMLGLIGSHWR